MTHDNRVDGNEKGNNSGYRKPQKKSYRDGNGGHRHDSNNRRTKDGGRTFFSRDGDKTSRPYKPRNGGDHPREGDRRHYGNGHSGGGRKPNRTREGDCRPHDRGDFKPRYKDGEVGHNGRRDFKPRDGEADSRERKSFDRNAREQVHDTPVPQTEQKLTIPSTPQKILFKGVDCEVNGRSDLAMALYLHGMVQMSRGCESNALRMLTEAGSTEFKTIRGRMAKLCPDEAMIAYDYLCMTLDSGYDGSFLRSAADAGDNIAIYYRICMDDVEGDDPCIDVFASKMSEEPQRVEDGLRLLARRRDSPKAEAHIETMKERKQLKQSIRETFVRARKGDPEAIRMLDRLSKMFPEAGFLKGYLAVDPEDGEEYLRNGMSEYRDTILSMCTEFGISKTPYGRFLAAKRLQVNEGEWINPMIEAVKAGSEDAMEELRPVQNRKDVRRSLVSIYLANGDVKNLVLSCDKDDTSGLDKYCDGDVLRILEVGRVMGGVREIDWLKKGFIEGHEECKVALVEMASQEDRHCKQLIYTLHDVGEDLEAAKLYMDMYGDATIPAVKWLSKVCENEDAKEYLRKRFDDMGEIDVFESIFIDDGYRRSFKPRGRPTGFNRGRR